MPTFHAALQTRQARAMVYSDSTGEGHAGQTPHEWQAAWPNLAPNFMSGGRTARSMSWAGWGHGGTFNPPDDDRWVLGTGWTAANATTFCSGGLLQNSANTASFTPTIVDANGNESLATFDSVRVWFSQHNSAAYGSATIADNGGATLATLNSHVVNDAVLSSATLGISTRVDVTATSGGTSNFRLCGLECWNSAETNAIRIVNAATSGSFAAYLGTNSASATLDTTPATSIQALMGFSPDLLVISLGLNDQTLSGLPIGPLAVSGSWLDGIDRLASPGNGGVSAVTSLNPGTGLTPGTYLSLSVSGGTGSGCVCDAVVTAGGTVNQVNLRRPGKQYTSGNTLVGSVPGGTFSFTVSTLKYDVLLFFQNPIGLSAQETYQRQWEFMNALCNYALAHGYPLVNMFGYYGNSYEVACGKGYMTFGVDTKHSTLLGYQQFAKQFAYILSNG